MKAYVISGVFLIGTGLAMIYMAYELNEFNISLTRAMVSSYANIKVSKHPKSSCGCL